MKKIKKGDIVARISYGKDILFSVERILTTSNNKRIAILKGVTIRIQADSYLDDLEIINLKETQEYIRNSETDFDNRVKKNTINQAEKSFLREQEVIYTGRILHIDGDKKYGEKSSKYYKKVGLKAVVKNIPEYSQKYYIGELLQRYKPDVLVLTGHDGMVKKGCKFDDIYNYRNSGYFIQTVIEARKQAIKKDLVIFAGACQSYYEGLIMAGANFASSPARILIDFMDPLIVAEKIAKTSVDRFVTIKDIENELRDGQRGVSGVGGRGKQKVLIL